MGEHKLSYLLTYLLHKLMVYRGTVVLQFRNL